MILISQFHLVSTHLARGEATIKKNGQKMSHLKTFLAAKSSPNFLWVLDSHSCFRTGGIRHGQGPNQEAWVAPIDMVGVLGPTMEFYLFISWQVFNKFTAQYVQQSLESLIMIKGVMVLCCGTVFTNSAHFDCMKCLVEWFV